MAETPRRIVDRDAYDDIVRQLCNLLALRVSDVSSITLHPQEAEVTIVYDVPFAVGGGVA